MTVEIPEQLESALKVQASALGVSPAIYVRNILERELDPNTETDTPAMPFKNSRGILAKYGPAPSAEVIDANRADMLCSQRT